MESFFKSYLLFILILAGGQAFSYEIIFDRIPSSSGLRSESVSAVGQSDDGYLWVGTQSGLQRYDGYRMANFRRMSSSDEIPPRPVEQILASGFRNEIWVVTGASIGLFNTRTFEYRNIPVLGFEPGNMEVIRSVKGITYLLLKGRALLIYNKVRGVFEKAKSLKGIPSDFNPQTMHLLNDGSFYIGGAKGIGYYEYPSGEFFTPEQNPHKLPLLTQTKGLKNVRLIFIDSKKRCFLQTWPPVGGSKLWLIDKKSKRSVLGAQAINKDAYYEINTITEQSGVLWAFGLGIFNIFEDDENAFINFYSQKSAIYGIPSNNIFQLFKDKDANLWLATDDGLYMASVVGDYIRNASYPSFGIYGMKAVLEVSPKHFLTSYWGGGVHAFSYDEQLVLRYDESFEKKVYAGAPKRDGAYKMVWDMAIDSSQTLWLACQEGRMIQYDMKRQKSAFLIPKLFKRQTIRTIARTKNTLFFGTQGGLVVSHSNGEWKTILDLQLPVSKLYIDKNTLWIATGGRGLLKYSLIEKKIVARYSAEKGRARISSNRITDMTFIGDSVLAIACDANIDLFYKKSLKIYSLNPYNVLSHNIVSSVTADGRGFLWMASNGGVVRYDLNKRRLRYYDQKDGMVNTSVQENLMHLSTKFSDNVLFFAGMSNFMLFRPDSLNRRFIPKDVSIAGLRLFNDYVPLHQLIKNNILKLKAEENFFSIYFSSLSYKQSKQLKYFYSFEKDQDKWIQIENGQAANFSAVAPGKYKFKIYAVNQAELRSPKITELVIEIEPKFYQTTWFMILVVSLCSLPVFIIYKLRMARLVAVYNLREKVARDLHDDMGSTLTTINILSVVAQRGLKNDEGPAKDYIKKIGENSSQMMESMDDIVWSIKPENDKLNKILFRLREHTINILELQGIDYGFIADEDMSNLKLPMDIRRNLFLIYKEALNNISKYAFASKVKIEIFTKNRILYVSVEDNGIGFDQSVLSEGNGLMNMSKRAEMMRGNLEITSAVGQGTSLNLSIPIP